MLVGLTKYSWTSTPWYVTAVMVTLERVFNAACRYWKYQSQWWRERTVMHGSSVLNRLIRRHDSDCMDVACCVLSWRTSKQWCATVKCVRCVMTGRWGACSDMQVVIFQSVCFLCLDAVLPSISTMSLHVEEIRVSSEVAVVPHKSLDIILPSIWREGFVAVGVDRLGYPKQHYWCKMSGYLSLTSTMLNAFVLSRMRSSWSIIANTRIRWPHSPFVIWWCWWAYAAFNVQAAQLHCAEHTWNTNIGSACWCSVALVQLLRYKIDVVKKYNSNPREPCVYAPLSNAVLHWLFLSH